MTAALGLSLNSGGTYAYFSDTFATQNTFAAGTLDLAVNPDFVVNIDNIKPGDEVYREFTLENNGSLDIHKVLLDTQYIVEDAKTDNVDDFGNHIEVTIMYNTSSATVPIVETTLYDLQTQQPDIAAIDTFVGNEQIPDGISAGEKEKMFVLFEFVDNGENQNQFQGASSGSTGHLMQSKQLENITKTNNIIYGPARLLLEQVFLYNRVNS
ncbi:spore coat-associated protein N [Cytobacillus purgationiresistens]|uniref:Spore coat-associated protein N n=1 Tax=Cytobacillus purgationiresistens TaxID=863449 RepID=A0ABU0ACP0_9BACI|nr:spore coat-associated protein N [Cytobacillus purgationiresistens]